MEATTALLVLALLACVAVLAAWWRERARSERLGVAVERERAAREHAEAGLQEERRGREALETALRGQGQRTAELEAGLERQRRRGDELDSALGRERRSRGELETALALERRARHAERAWAQELRAQVMTLHRQRSILAREHDVTELILHVAIELLEAERGLLLARRDEDGDGQLDLVCHEGFEHDPAGSALAQRFARASIARDEIFRADDPALGGEDRTPADDEIHCLVAIPIYVRDDFAGVVVCADRPGGFENYDDDVLLALGDHAGSVLESSRLRGELRTSYLATVAILADAIATKDPFVGGHSEEVAEYVGAVAERLKIAPGRREELVFGSLLHDLGKIGISERILLKPGGLTAEERAVVELHPRIGYRLISRIPALDALAPAILHHHERWDGDGYPTGLRRTQIPIEARIIGVADAFSAMTSDRPFAAPMTVEEACEELERCAGTQFDPRVVALFVREVRAHPPQAGRGRLGEALGDPELAALAAHGPLVGSGTLAAIDNLTQLYSHRYLHETATAAERYATLEGRPFAIVMVDLDGLPGVNGRDGYTQGDELIRTAGRVLHQVAASCRGTACRYGGSRLALLLPDGRRAPEVVERLETELPAEGEPRIAVAVWQPGETGAEVVERARRQLRGAAAGVIPPPR